MRPAAETKIKRKETSLIFQSFPAITESEPKMLQMKAIPKSVSKCDFAKTEIAFVPKNALTSDAANKFVFLFYGFGLRTEFGAEQKRFHFLLLRESLPWEIAGVKQSFNIQLLLLEDTW